MTNTTVANTTSVINTTNLINNTARPTTAYDAITSNNNINTDGGNFKNTTPSSSNMFAYPHDSKGVPLSSTSPGPSSSSSSSVISAATAAAAGGIVFIILVFFLYRKSKKTYSVTLGRGRDVCEVTENVNHTFAIAGEEGKSVGNDYAQCSQLMENRRKESFTSDVSCGAIDFESDSECVAEQKQFSKVAESSAVRLEDAAVSTHYVNVKDNHIRPLPYVPYIRRKELVNNPYANVASDASVLENSYMLSAEHAFSDEKLPPVADEQWLPPIPDKANERSLAQKPMKLQQRKLMASAAAHSEESSIYDVPERLISTQRGAPQGGNSLNQDQQRPLDPLADGVPQKRQHQQQRLSTLFKRQITLPNVRAEEGHIYCNSLSEGQINIPEDTLASKSIHVDNSTRPKEGSGTRADRLSVYSAENTTSDSLYTETQFESATKDRRRHTYTNCRLDFPVYSNVDLQGSSPSQRQPTVLVAVAENLSSKSKKVAEQSLSTHAGQPSDSHPYPHLGKTNFRASGNA